MGWKWWPRRSAAERSSSEPGESSLGWVAVTPMSRSTAASSPASWMPSAASSFSRQRTALPHATTVEPPAMKARQAMTPSREVGGVWVTGFTS